MVDVERLPGEDGPNLLTVAAMNSLHLPGRARRRQKLFADGSMPRAYKLARSRVSGTGVMIGEYEREGEINIGDAPAN
jgi:hypothetical protein